MILTYSLFNRKSNHQTGTDTKAIVYVLILIAVQPALVLETNTSPSAIFLYYTSKYLVLIDAILTATLLQLGL